MKKKIKIYFVDFWLGFELENNYFINLLREHYEIELDPVNPDFLFYSEMGTKHKNYNCVRIYFTGENTRPNFNKTDYAFSFDYLDTKRNYRLPLYELYGDANELLNEKDLDRILEEKTRFCNFIYSNPNQKVRNRFFKKLSKYKKVDSAGRFWNNIGGPVRDKLQFIRQYKFTIAFENGSHPGYTTEKIFEPMLVNSIPIYWGNELVYKDFNPRSFINYHDFENEEELIEWIIEVDNNPDEYVKILKEPYFNNNQINEFIKKENILKQFEYIFNNDIEPVSGNSMVFSGFPPASVLAKAGIDFKFHGKRFWYKFIHFRPARLKARYLRMKERRENRGS